MKRALLLLLTFSILGAGIHADELLRLPFLIKHYSEHHRSHQGDSFAVFLYKHYVVNQTPESAGDRKSDARLPFKSSRSILPHFDVFIVASVAYHTFFSSRQMHAEFPKGTALLYARFDIWQPPRIV